MPKKSNSDLTTTRDRCHYEYLYLRARGRKPLRRCPDCRGSLTRPESVFVNLSTAGGEEVIYTCLDQDGWLIDDDGAVWNGFHSEAGCASCHTVFIEMAGVVEQQRQHYYRMVYQRTEELETEL